MSESESSIRIVTAADNNFAMPLCVTLFSILKNVNQQAILHFYILDGGIEKRNKKKIERIFTFDPEDNRHHLEWIDQDVHSIEDLPLHSWMSRATYLRLFLPELLPSGIKKVIYLDCDLILETDIQELWNYHTNGAVIGAARDVLIQNLSHSTGVKNYKKYGGETHSPYFNSGVMVINMERWRYENISKKSMEYLEENREVITLHEQEALNAALIGKWSEFDPRWNQQASIFWSFVLPETEFTKTIRSMYGDLVSKPYIIHYISKSKPWDHKCMHPAIGRFMFYLKESRWFTKPGWAIWWRKHYLKRFFWLFGDLKKTLNMLKVKSVLSIRKRSQQKNESTGVAM